MLSDQLARGVPLTDALRASVDAFATGSATAAQKLKLVQFGADAAFDREQLGRDRYDQSAFARARSTVGDTTAWQPTRRAEGQPLYQTESQPGSLNWWSACSSPQSGRVMNTCAMAAIDAAPAARAFMVD
ncbi:hypothetical protein Mrad2831_6515 (plasmid) [Methylobacterium radiotolerans JCM 2831]|uniref:Uncharacterized protein n=1 Tax=Methylobacterium radiotolerans (strain ATCC 27329 / DSM 1819 / JCM 2831 / NBRC 15690 / NCIMB 10815 / 0-1) TaxID=426355 RepID=B1MAA2_METRJ|nr:hypothetical protein Mrad2831_6515 [Methylobacterium radiotolerans JCM 2831]GEN01534.1 hypothetical protein MRA01_60730 [Methylobacterium radiotolerans]